MAFRVLLLLLVFVASSAQAAQWRYEESVDKMTGKVEQNAHVRSDNTLNLSFPYAGENHGVILVRKHPRHGLDVMVAVDKGQILCRAYDGCSIMVRFGDQKPQRFSVSEASDHSSEVVFVQNTKKFIDSARKSKKILIQIPMFQQGEQVLEFSVPVELVWK